MVTNDELVKILIVCACIWFTNESVVSFFWLQIVPFLTWRMKSVLKFISVFIVFKKNAFLFLLSFRNKQQKQIGEKIGAIADATQTPIGK